MNRQFRYLGPYDRAEIERLHNRGATVAVIADKIGAHTATIYRELSNGYERDADGEPVIDAYGRGYTALKLRSGHLNRTLRTAGSGRVRNDRNRLLCCQNRSEKMDKEQVAIERLKTASEMSPMEQNTRRGVTLAAVLSLLQPHENVFIMHRISPHELEAVGGGTVEGLRAIRCAETCGGYEVERLELVVDDLKEDWTKPDKPVLVITIGEKER